jgi:hypothetical protein
MQSTIPSVVGPLMAMIAFAFFRVTGWLLNVCATPQLKLPTKIEDIATRHNKTLGAFSRIVPSFRATRLLLVAERASLVADVEEF